MQHAAVNLNPFSIPPVKLTPPSNAAAIIESVKKTLKPTPSSTPTAKSSRSSGYFGVVRVGSKWSVNLFLSQAQQTKYGIRASALNCGSWEEGELLEAAAAAEAAYLVLKGERGIEFKETVSVTCENSQKEMPRELSRGVYHDKTPVVTKKKQANPSGYIGVTKNYSAWAVRVPLNTERSALYGAGKKFYCGQWDELEAAGAAAEAAYFVLIGEKEIQERGIKLRLLTERQKETLRQMDPFEAVKMIKEKKWKEWMKWVPEGVTGAAAGCSDRGDMQPADGLDNTSSRIVGGETIFVAQKKSFQPADGLLNTSSRIVGGSAVMFELAEKAPRLVGGGSDVVLQRQRCGQLTSPLQQLPCFESTQNTEKAPRLVGGGSDAALQRQSFREAAAAAEAACLAIKGEKKIAFQVLGEREREGLRGLGRSGAVWMIREGEWGRWREWRLVLEELMGGNGRKREREQEERGTEIGRGKRRHAVSGNDGGKWEKEGEGTGGEGDGDWEREEEACCKWCWKQ
ncbi:unnamed protein product [Closterium sp. NIES-65]|nr:unnamed protein product [Closterium sp. NIES-65]